MMVEKKKIFKKIVIKKYIVNSHYHGQTDTHTHTDTRYTHSPPAGPEGNQPAQSAVSSPLVGISSAAPTVS